MKHFFIAILAFLMCMTAHAYNDHRGHNLDSLERVVASWTPDAMEKASQQQLTDLNKAYRELMLGYNVINGEKSLFYARKALSISHPRGWNSADCDVYRYIGLYFYGKEQYDSALVYYKLSLDAARRMAAGAVSPDCPDGYSEYEIDDCHSALYGTIGNLYNMMGQLPEAMEWYDKAGQLFDKHGWNESNSVLHYNIGETWMDEAEYNKAAAAYDKALGYALASGDSLMIIGAYKGLGRLYLAQNKPWKAMHYLRDAEEYYSHHPDYSPGFRTENLLVMNQALTEQKKQVTMMLAGAGLLIVLAVGIILLIGCLRRARTQNKETSAIIDETLSELAQSKACGHCKDVKVSDREKDILDFLSKGYTTTQIAGALSLSQETIRWYRKKLLVKFDVSNAAELVSTAKENGVI